MRFNFIWIPTRDSLQAKRELNALFSSLRAVQVEKHFCPPGEEPLGWAVSVEWPPGPDVTGQRGETGNDMINVDGRMVSAELQRRVDSLHAFTEIASCPAWRRRVVARLPSFMETAEP